MILSLPGSHRQPLQAPRGSALARSALVKVPLCDRNNTTMKNRFLNIALLFLLITVSKSAFAWNVIDSATRGGK
ncbi:MAG: hypothetical protein ACKOEZ_10385, partial [Spartobacteria bacterium]